MPLFYPAHVFHFSNPNVNRQEKGKREAPGPVAQLGKLDPGVAFPPGEMRGRSGVLSSAYGRKHSPGGFLDTCLQLISTFVFSLSSTSRSSFTSVLEAQVSPIPTLNV